MSDLVERAKALAHRAHAGQVDKAGRPYIEHVARVAEAVRSDGRCPNEECNLRGEIVDWDSVGCSDPSCCSPASRPCPDCDAAEAVAWLHDVLEDCPRFVSEIETFPAYIRRAVIRLTRYPQDTPADYYGEIRRYPATLRVKLADIADNADEARLSLLDAATANRLRRKYAKARIALGEATGE